MKVVAALLLFLSFCAIVIVPFQIIELKKTTNTIIRHQEYKKMKVLVLDYYSSSKDLPGEGSGGGNELVLEIHQPKLTLRIDDENDVLFGKKAEQFNKERKAVEYLESHNDSIWIWYAPELVPKFAEENAKSYALDEDYDDLTYQIVTIISGVLVIIITVLYNKKYKDTRNA